MTFRIVLLPRAEADLEANARWWAENHSLEQAMRWLEAMHVQLKSLAQFPERNGLSRENDDFSYEIRDKPLGLGPRPSYRAVITIKDHTVFVLTVRRASQDALRPDQVDAPPFQ